MSFFRPKSSEKDPIRDLAAAERKLRDLDKVIADRQNYLIELNHTIGVLDEQLIKANNELLLQSFGLYEPLFDFINSEEYKKRLDREREVQKEMIRLGKAISGNKEWVVNGSKQEGAKLSADLQKLFLRAFNNECDEAILKVRFSNIEQSIKRIRQSYESISKLGRIINLKISEEYYISKIRELRIAFEYAEKKADEKEAAKVLREQQREEAKVQREIEYARQKIKKEQSHYETELATLVNLLDVVQIDKKLDVLEKIEKTKQTLGEIQKSLDDVDYREANQRAGYVYVISNIGAFGPNVFKIGMTRRLEPLDRIAELSDSSVPFNFDVHAMIFSDNAPGLEAALHRRFEKNKVNMVNFRREFFYATIGEIKQVIRENYDKVVDIIDIPEAEQYRISQKMRSLNNG